MLKEIFKGLEELVRDKIPTVKVGRYKGEFEEGADWNPAFPAVLIRVNSLLPTERNMSGQVISYSAEFTLYIADRDMNQPSGLDTIEAVINTIEDNSITNDDYGTEYDMKVGDDGMKFLGYGNQVEVYILNVNVQCSM